MQVSDELMDYETFVGAPACDSALQPLRVLPPHMRLSVPEFTAWAQHTPHVLLDIRPALEFGICALPRAVNVPWHRLVQCTTGSSLAALALRPDTAVAIVCRRGNDSQLAVQHLRALLPTSTAVCDIAGGLVAWAAAHPEFTLY